MDPNLVAYYTQYYQGLGYDSTNAYYYAITYLNNYYQEQAKQTAGAANALPGVNTPEVVSQPSILPTISAAPTSQGNSKTSTPAVGKPAGNSTNNTNAATTNSTQQQQQQQKKEEWPESLREYVTRVFDCTAEENKGEASKRLRALIQSHQQNNTLWDTDWTKMPLIQITAENATAQRAPPRQQQQLGRLRSKSPPKSTKKNKAAAANPSATMLKPSPANKFPKSFAEVTSGKKSKTENNTNNLGFVIDNSPNLIPDLKRKSFSGTGSPDLGPLMASDEIARREKRARRFNDDDSGIAALNRKMKNDRAKAAFLAAGASGNPDIVDWDEHTIVGTSETLEKRYLRLTSAPDPSTVRPLAVLKKTLELLISKWKQERNYTFICDQFKSLRQDLTVQRIKNVFTVSVYEIHARIALEMGDLGEYNQCQAQLEQLYELSLQGSVDEFIGYRIIYMIHTLNNTDLNRIMARLTNKQKQQKNIKHALAVRRATTQNDYHMFFKLYEDAPDMSSYLMDHFIGRQRQRAMQSICKAYRPTIKTSLVAKELGFNDEDPSRSLRRWMADSCGIPMHFTSGEELKTKELLPTFVSLNAQSQKVDIKGQIH